MIVQKCGLFVVDALALGAGFLLAVPFVLVMAAPFIGAQ